MLETPAGLKVGQNVDLFLSGKIVALGIMEFIGVAGQQRWWGMRTIGKGKALLQLKKVFVRGSKPPF
jgi:hypothetical protein